VTDKAFGSRDLNEMVETYTLIGRTGGEDAVGFLTPLFKRKGFFGKKKRERLRACAAHGLAATGTDTAYDLLRSGAGEGQGELSKACREGLEKMDRQRGGR